MQGIKKTMAILGQNIVLFVLVCLLVSFMISLR